MNDLKIKKLTDEKLYWERHNCHYNYSSYYDYRKHDSHFKHLNQLVTAKEFYDISQPYKDWYDITGMIEYFEKLYNTKEIILFAIRRYDGEIIIENTFSTASIQNEPHPEDTYYLKYDNSDPNYRKVKYNPHINKSQKYIVGVNTVNAIDTFNDQQLTEIRNLISGKKIYDTFMKDAIETTVNNLCKDLAENVDLKYSKPLNIREKIDKTGIKLKLELENLDKKIQKELREEINKLIYNKILKKYFEPLGIDFNFKCEDTLNFEGYLLYEDLVNNNKQEV